MINDKHKYKVINSFGRIVVTYDDYQKARQYVRNISKERGLKLQIKNVEQKEGAKNV